MPSPRLLSALPLLLLCACRSGNEAAADAGATPAPLIAQDFAALRATFVQHERDGRAGGSFVRAPEARSLRVLSDRIEPELDSAVATTSLPLKADGAFHVASRGASIDVALVGARPSPATTDNGVVHYAAALGEDTSLFHVPFGAGTEEYVLYRTRPRSTALRYDVTLHGVGGLRLVSGILEFVLPSGVPALRTRAPIVMDSKGTVREGSLRVEGCSIDTSGDLPFDRAPTSPGAERCTVVASFDDSGLEYPIAVDPAWTSTTGTLAAPYYQVVAAPFKTAGGTCASGCVLIPGGVLSYGAYGAPASSPTAQVYSESTSTFTATSSTTFRGYGAVSLGDRVMVFSYGGTTDIAIYSASPTATWTTIPASSLPGYGGSFGPTTLGDASINMELNGDVYVDASIPSSSTTRYDGLLKYSGGVWSSLGTPSYLVGSTSYSTKARYGYMLSGFRTTGNLVLVGGGRWLSDYSTTAVDSTETDTYFEPTPWKSWTVGPSLSVGRWAGTTVRSADQKYWYYAGGETGGGGGPVQSAIDIWDGTTFKSANLNTARSAAVSAPFGPSGALIVGGRGASGVLKTAEHVAPTGAILSVTTMAYAHSAAAPLASGRVLAVGCPSSYAPCGGTQAETIGLLPNGAACAINGDCYSANCVDGVCCNSACTGQCQACNLTGSVGTCTTVTPTNAPTGYSAGKPVTGFGTTVRTVCAGYSTATCSPKCDGTSATSCTTPGTSVLCKAATCASGTENPAAYCNGAGACPSKTPVSCGSFACGTSGTCLTACTVAGPSQCAPGFSCNVTTGKCLSTGTAGAECVVASDCIAGLTCVPSDKGKSVCCSVSSCPSGKFCAGASAGPVAGKCVAAIGSTCSVREDCATACVDGFCCDTACNGQCEACDVAGSEGTCSPVSGKPHGAREACSDGAGDVCRALACDGGTDRTKCVAFAHGSETTCGAATCVDGVETKASTCGGGECVKGAVRPCAPYACDAAACKNGCATSADCAKGFVCGADGKCSPASAKCTDDNLASTPPDGTEPLGCSPFLCDRTDGKCRHDCTSSDQCAPGFVCDGTTCTPAPAAGTDDGGGCVLGAPIGVRTGATSALLVAMAIAAGRFRRRR